MFRSRFVSGCALKGLKHVQSECATLEWGARGSFTRSPRSRAHVRSMLCQVLYFLSAINWYIMMFLDHAVVSDSMLL